MTRAPQVTAREILAFLMRHGFAEDRHSGSHVTLRNEETRKSVTGPVHTGCDIGRGLTARILRDAGFELEDYLASR